MNDKLTIKIKKDYKSITSGSSFDLPRFSLITGVNGSGKTHLLEALSNPQISDIFINNNKTSNIKFIKFNGLNPTGTEECKPQLIYNHASDLFKKYRSGLNNFKAKHADVEPTIQQISSNYDNKTKMAIENICKLSQKDHKNLTEEDFFQNVDVHLLYNRDYLTSHLALIFKNYHRKYIDNDFYRYQKEQGKPIDFSILSESEFIERHGSPPWNYFNSIFETLDFPYILNSPEGSHKDSVFKIELKNKHTYTNVRIDDLSTGEKVIICFALAIYNSKIDSVKPDVLIIDEPDAGLHPSMALKMINVIEDHIIPQDIYTIITSHSPSTVISADSNSLYEMTPERMIPERIVKQKAIENLTSGVPFLKVSNESRRQVLVESKYDVIYYELLYNIISKHNIIQTTPIFIPANTSNGSNCTDVIKMVNEFIKCGNDKIYGIIDWDGTNVSTDRVFVLGSNERYSIENYILDPLLMGLYFIREKHESFHLLKNLSFENYIDSQQINKEDAQTIINSVLSQLQFSLEPMVNYTLFNGWELSISPEINSIQGHELEDLYKNKFQFLKRFHQENMLKQEIIKMIMSDHFELCPKELFEVFKKIL